MPEPPGWRPTVSRAEPPTLTAASSRPRPAPPAVSKPPQPPLASRPPDDSPTPPPIPAAMLARPPDRAVFVDDGGRRARWARRAGSAVGMLALAYLVLAGAALAGAPWVPRAALPSAGSVGPRRSSTPASLGSDAVVAGPLVTIPATVPTTRAPAVPANRAPAPAPPATVTVTGGGTPGSGASSPATTVPGATTSTAGAAPSTSAPGRSGDRRPTSSSRPEPPGRSGTP